jgi:hypothetical protein
MRKRKGANLANTIKEVFTKISETNNNNSNEKKTEMATTIISIRATTSMGITMEEVV